MGQKGFFDVERRLEAISAMGDPLETIKKIVPWEDFRADIEAVTETKPEERKSNAGRKPYDTILKFKIVVLQSLHNLSDERTEYLIRDRISFMRFLDLGLEDPVPDATTIWLFREALAQAGLVDKLFARFGPMMKAVDFTDRLHEIKCPMLNVVPGHDPLGAPGQYEVYKKHVPHCEFIVYEGLPHNITDSVPERCANDLRDFLRRHRQVR